MNTSRETIYAALFAKFAAVPGIITRSRKLEHWTDVVSSRQPALFQAQRNETPGQVQRLPAKWSLRADIYLYVHTGEGTDTVSSTLMNPLVDAIEAALAPDPLTEMQDLGLPGVVSHCWIAGTIETDEGVLGPQGVAIIPVEILAV